MDAIQLKRLTETAEQQHSGCNLIHCDGSMSFLERNGLRSSGHNHCFVMTRLGVRGLLIIWPVDLLEQAFRAPVHRPQERSRLNA